MFVRVKDSPNSPKKAVQIVQTYREGNKVRQRIVRHVGTALNEDEVNRLQELAYYIISQMEHQQQPRLFSPEDMAQMAIEARNKPEDEKPLPVDLKQLREKQRIVLGIHEVYGQIYNELGFGKVLNNYSRKEAAVKNLFHIVMGRLANPASKMATVNDLEQHFGIKLSLASVYRIMDEIDDKVIDKIQDKAYKATQGLFSEPIRVAFYDCTTLYFESFIEDELKQKGYSKDLKFNQSQVLLALLVTESGLPLGYQVYEGSKYEGHTLKNAIERIQHKYNVSDITFVADSAMFNKDNLNLLNQLDKKYIVGARLKNMSQNIQKQILDKEGYTILKHDQDNEIFYKELIVNGQRLIITYNLKNAIKDSHDRKEYIEKLMQKLKGGTVKATDLIKNFGYKKFIRIEGENSISLDEEKIAQEELWDGIRGIMTNDMQLSVGQLIEQYHGLWQVEESFRISKHDLKVRPVYHWTPQRIKAHIAICFMAFTCARHLSYRLRIQKELNISIEKIRQTLVNIQLSILKDLKTGKHYGLPSTISQEARKIYHAVGIKLSDVPFEIT